MFCRLIFFYFVYLHVFFFSYCDDGIFNHENPCLFHHVNVLSGQLNFHFLDLKVQGEIPLSINRGYSSLGGLEKEKNDFDLRLKELRGGFLIQGGWNLFSYTNLLLYESKNGSMKAYLAEPNSGVVTYEMIETPEGEDTLLIPLAKGGQCYGSIGASTALENYRLKIHSDDGVAELLLPDGGKRKYFRVIHDVKNKDIGFENVFYRLVEETLSSGHIIDYFYDRFTRLCRIEAKSPDRKQIYSWIDINIIQSMAPMILEIKTSDGQTVKYRGSKIDDRDYLGSVKKDENALETIKYEKLSPDGGAFLKEIYRGKQLFFAVDYYSLEDIKEVASYEANNKVKAIYLPDPKTGKKTLFATFEYFKNITIVNDHHQILTKYFHDEGLIDRIEKYDSQHELYSTTKFFWKDRKLIAKVILDPEGKGIISKTFEYDERGNVIKETLYGDLTGEKESRFTVDETGQLLSADTLKRGFKFDEKNRLLEEIQEEDLTFSYEYLQDTNLVKSKWTLLDHQIVQREFYFYDKNYLLKKEVIDDGKSDDCEDLTQVTYRRTLEHGRNEKNGVVDETIEAFTDIESLKDIKTKKVVNHYDQNQRIVSQDHYNFQDGSLVSIDLEYDLSGRVIKRRDHLGREEVYRYDSFGNLIEQKEIGKPKKLMTYDFLGRICKIVNSDGDIELVSSYDLKGNPIFSEDRLGKITRQEYNAFSLCEKTTLFEKSSGVGIQIGYSYDTQGNLEKVVDPSGIEQMTFYTGLRKPKEIIKKDGSKTYYFYTKSGLLSKIIYPDSGFLIKKYDPFHRLIQEEVYDKNGEKLAEETFIYRGFFLIEYVNKSGLKITYTYDNQGRKIQEDANGRIVRFEYNGHNCVNRIIYEHYDEIIEYDLAFRKVRSYEIDRFEKIENERTYQYNDDNLITQTALLTSNGYVYDQFFYDQENRLIKHIDPDRNVTQFEYVFSSCPGSSEALIKKTIRPDGQVKVEGFDYLMKLVKLQIEDQDGQILSSNQYIYDQLGNQTHVSIDVYDQRQFLKTHTLEFSYDLLGQKIEEIEDGISKKKLSYDALGRVSSIKFPSGKAIFYEFDELNRITKISSKDRAIEYHFEYDLENHSVKIFDLQQGSMIERIYSPFGELIYEKDSLGNVQAWDYDCSGRLVSYQLPDDSVISYIYDKHLKTLEKRNSLGSAILKHEFLEYGLTGKLEIEKYHRHKTYNYHRYDRLDRKVASYGAFFQQNCTYSKVGQIQEYANTFEGPKSIDYDLLGQIVKEGEINYDFDSIGNPKNCVTKGISEIEEIDGIHLSYDLDGNIVSKADEEGITNYRYDQLNRLVEIEKNNQKIELFYDPLSRISQIQKADSQETIFYYQEEDIGSMAHDGHIISLKINSAVNNTIYVESDGEVKIPITDFQGNIRGLLNLDGTLYDYAKSNFFGSGSLKSCPWSFSGKRRIGDLFYFLERFYDPEIKRWISRDPSGYCEGFNLYAYVLNDPVNRIDLFGLNSQELMLQDLKIPIPMKCFMDLGESKGLISSRGYIGNAQVDWVVSYGNFQQLKFTPEEVETGIVDIIDHFEELIPSDGKLIGMITAQNGIMTSKEDFELFSHSITKKIDEGVLFLGLHNPSEGIVKDINRAVKEMVFQETFAVAKTRQFMEAMITALEKVNPDLIWTHIVHSEAGAIARVALEKMHPEAQEKVKKQMKVFALAPAMPIPNHLVLEAENVYSDLDFITGFVGRIYSYSKNYNITFTDCISNIEERSFLFSDHAFLGRTYKHAVANKLEEERKRFNLR